MTLKRKATLPQVEPTHWDVLHLLMQVDPPPAIGDDWLDGVFDGVYQAQCYLTGLAQGYAGRGDIPNALIVAKAAVDLNGQRRAIDAGATK